MEGCIPVPIAIIGIGCRLSGSATDPESFWDLISNGRDTWTPVPETRFNSEAFHDPSPSHGGMHSHGGGHYIQSDIAAFDAAFFDILPEEAAAMDPQQRILCEIVFEALENAGITLQSVRGSITSVYVANFSRDYDRNLFKDPLNLPRYHMTGCGDTILSNRISYLLDLHGPSVTMDSGCSGGLVALHQACQSLRTKESDMSLVAAANLILNPDYLAVMSSMNMLNVDGRSYAFDARGAGYGRGEGVTAVVLKRLDDALMSGDHVRAVIRNTAVNQDGKTNGITLPSSEAQCALLRQIYLSARIDPTDVDYV